MNKRDLVGRIAAHAQLTRSQASRALDAVLDGVAASLVDGDRVTLVGFGTFSILQRKARVVRDPHRGTTMQIEAQCVARFTPGLELKAAIRSARQPQTAASS
jgi:DNA-binding protein HU-beta